MNVYTKSPAKGETAKAAQPSQVAPSPARKRPRWRRAALMVSLPVLLAIGGGWYWLDGGRYVETENAYVQQAKTLISSDVSAAASSTSRCTRTSRSRQGDVLFHIDPEPYRIAVARPRPNSPTPGSTSSR